MWQDIIIAVWFFLPAGAANMAPIFAAKLPGLRRWSTPLDLGFTYKGIRLFGDHKTWRGLLSGILLGIFVALLQQIMVGHFNFPEAVAVTTPTLLLGGLLGFGALAGDAAKSFFKRRLGRRPGDSWLPFDQLDYIAGGIVLTIPFFRLSLEQYIWLCIVWSGLHIVVSYAGFLLRLKGKPI
ncbi:MAG TPA: CDP-archaeol synthase [Candidatus Acidoferrum sp.]|nr:CDP-archaeol synthase [Candidatus Acidoferrum sp.]